LKHLKPDSTAPLNPLLSLLSMVTLKERKRRGEETAKRYRALTGNDSYAVVVDAIADLLLAVAQTEREATQLMHSAEIEFRNQFESEQIVSEG
jgi:hypothetical protein